MSQTEAEPDGQQNEPFVAKSADDVLSELNARPDGGPAPGVQAQAERYAKGFLAQTNVPEFRSKPETKAEWEARTNAEQAAWEARQAAEQTNWEKRQVSAHEGRIQAAQDQVPLAAQPDVTLGNRVRNMDHSDQLQVARQRRPEAAQQVAGEITHEERLRGVMHSSELQMTRNQSAEDANNAVKPKRLLSRLAEQGRKTLRRLRNRDKGEGAGQ